VHDAYRTKRHPPDRPAIEYLTCAIISGPLHQVSYSCHNPRRCPSCRTCHLHTLRQANTILHTNKIKVVEPSKCPGFKFKPHQVNDSLQSNQGTDHLVSHIIHFSSGNRRTPSSPLHPSLSYTLKPSLCTTSSGPLPVDRSEVQVPVSGV
jgi:hypothetical protein